MIRKRSMLFLAILSALATACHSRRATFDRQDAVVYAVVLDSLFGADATRRRGIVLSDSTEQYLREKLVPEFWSAFDAVAEGDTLLVRDFEVRSRTRSSLRASESTVRIELKTPFVFASDSDFQRVKTRADSLRKLSVPEFLSSATAFWQVFHRTFADAAASVSVSAVGYSHAGTTALVYVEYGCGALCGAGTIVVLQRTDTGWRIHRVRGTWVS